MIPTQTRQGLTGILGATGARKLLATYNSEVFNAQEMGAKGDGETDDTAAFRRIITEVEIFGEGAVLVIPKGTYLVQDASTATSTTPILTNAGSGITIIGWGGVFKIGANGAAADVIRITGARNQIVGLTVDANGSGLAAAASSKDNTGFAINEGEYNQLAFCKVINGRKTEGLHTQGENCFVVTNGLYNRIEHCVVKDAAWQAYRTTGGHTSIVNCIAVGFRGNAVRVLDGEAVYISGCNLVQAGAGGRSCILVDPGSAASATAKAASNDADSRISLCVIRDCYLQNGINGPDGTVNCLKIAAVKEVIVEGCYMDATGSSNVSLSLEDCIHQATVRSCFIKPYALLRQVDDSSASSVFQGTLGGTVSSANLVLDVNGDGVDDAAADYVVYTVAGHGLVLGKTIFVRGSSVAAYNGPQEVVAVTATTITTNRKYVSASIGSNAWAHSGVDKVDFIDCRFENDQAGNTFVLETLNAPFVNIENCVFKNLTENTIKQSLIQTGYVGDFAIQRFRVVKSKFYMRSTNICRAIRFSPVTTFLTSGKTIAWGNEVYSDRIATNVQLVDTYDSGDTSATTYANRATLFNSDGDRVSCYTGTAKPTGTDITFLAGDRIRNTASAAGGAPGFVCTTGGAVGTWKNEAVLEA